MEAQLRATAGVGMKAELHLVAIAERLGRWHDRSDGRRREPAQVDQGLSDLPLLQPALLRVLEVLEAAASATLHVRAPRGHAVGAHLVETLHPGFREAPANAREPSRDLIPGQSTIDEHDAAVVVREGLTAQDEVGQMEG